MTLREFGQSIVRYWDSYWTQVTTQNVLDWSIGNLFITFVGGFIAFVVGMAVIGGGLAILFVKVSEAWEKSGLPYTWVRLDKRFGVFVSGLIMVAGTIAFLAFIGLLAALFEIATQ